MKKNTGVSTKCVHSGELKDNQYKGATSPLFPSTAYDFIDVDNDKYPRYFNTPNQLALSKKISEKTFDTVMANTKFLPKVIGYDRYQPEFYEDTKTYITKRTSKKKVGKGRNFYQNNDQLIFSHKIQKGGSTKSYGIEAAKLAGVPKEVIEKAKSVLNSLEENNNFDNNIY